MNKKIKRTISMALTLSALASAVPATSINILGLQEANASSKDKIHFDELKVSGAGKIKLSDSKTKYSIYVPRENETATITIKKESSKDKITCDSDGVRDIEGDEEGKSTCKIKVDLDNKGNDENEFEVKVSDDEGNERKYTLKIYRKHVSDDDDEDNDDIYLDDINLSDGTIDFSRKKASFDIEVDKDVDSIKIQAKPEDEDYKVEIGGEEVDKDCKWRTEVNLKEGKNTIDIYVEDEDDDDNPQRTYKLNIYRGTKATVVTNSGEKDTKQDKIYIKKVVIDDGDIPIAFDKEITSYDIKVKKDLENIIIKAEPEDNDDIVKINGSKVDSNYRKRVPLDATGKTTIELKVYNDEDDDDDDYEERIYNLNIIKEDGTTTDKNNNNEVATNTNNNQSQSTVDVPATTTGTNSSVKASKWVKNEYGLWQYYDALGKPIVNQWFKDGANWYYLGNYGIMQTGWQNINGAWYYLNNSGVMQTGWVQDRGAWYYLNDNGTMKTGWHQDSNGKWYYLNEHGVMLTNVYVNNYKLGADGAWVR